MTATSVNSPVSSARSTRFQRAVWAALVIGWCVAVGAVWYWGVEFAFRTTESADVASGVTWPAGCGIDRQLDKPTLVLFVHPRCPCTRASVAELDKLLQDRGLQPTMLPHVVVLASCPAGKPSEWRDTDVVRGASALPSATLIFDAVGQLTNHFGATTSGTVMLYDRDGERRFFGGVTMSRAHHGDNLGTTLLRKILTNEIHGAGNSVPVFGCELWPIRRPVDVARSHGDVCDPDPSVTERAGVRTL